MNRNRFSLLLKSIVLIAIAIVSTVPAVGQRGGGGMGMGMDMGMGVSGMSAAMTPLDRLKDSLRSAKSEAAQKRIIEKIKTMLSNQYDEFLQRNESELREMEKSVKGLRVQLERRKKAKGQLLDLEIQRISNEATGLVWPAEQNSFSMGMGYEGMGSSSSGMGGVPSIDMNEFITPSELSAAGSGEEIRENNGALSEPTSDLESKTITQLRQISLAILNFESANAHLPSNVSDDQGKGLLSWRVAILPYIEQQHLYNKFKLDEPWNSDHNLKLLDEMPDVFKNADSESSIRTVYLGFDGPGTMFESGKKLGFKDIVDGASNTLLVAKMHQRSAIEWTKPKDIAFKPGTPVTQLAESKEGAAFFARCDASAGKTKLKDVSAEELETIIRRDDGIVSGIAN